MKKARNRLPDYLREMHQAITWIQEMTENMSKDEFMSNIMAQLAISKCIDILGEKANRIQEDYSSFTKHHPEIPWDSMYGIRNRSSHDYFSLDLNIIWNVTQKSIPDLAKNLPKIDNDPDIDSDLSP